NCQHQAVARRKVRPLSPVSSDWDAFPVSQVRNRRNCSRWLTSARRRTEDAPQFRHRQRCVPDG
ncbi:hypothetical protein, partial [Leifsonia sp. CL147]|uniref:hypothetical protein n=2 Tax=unclassified Leifsonia TaxID=2663824 RepID=UPI001BA45EA1